VGFAAACLLGFALIAAWVSWSAPSTQRSGKTPVTVTLAPGANRPAGLTVVDLDSVEQLQARFDADKAVPRLVLAFAPT
jgi:hypothetical protein